VPEELGAEMALDKRRRICYPDAWWPEMREYLPLTTKEMPFTEAPLCSCIRPPTFVGGISLLVKDDGK
jgi:hypothetical protein